MEILNGGNWPLRYLKESGVNSASPVSPEKLAAHQNGVTPQAVFGLLLAKEKGMERWLAARSYQIGSEPAPRGAAFYYVRSFCSNAVGADLEHTGLITEETEAAFTSPLLFARNGGGDVYTSDGNVLIINYTRTPLLLAQPVWGIEGLKRGIFLFYETLFTVPGALMTFLGLVAVLGFGLLLWQRRARNRIRGIASEKPSKISP